MNKEKILVNSVFKESNEEVRKELLKGKLAQALCKELNKEEIKYIVKH